MANHDTKSIIICNKSYQLPVLEGNSFSTLQTEIKQCLQVIKQESREIIKQKKINKKFLFGLVSKTETVTIKTTEKLTFEQKFQELDRLVEYSDQLIAFLTVHKALYQQFVSQLTYDLRIVVKQKLQEASQQEQERLELVQDVTNLELISILDT
jgi:hypothetical protein